MYNYIVSSDYFSFYIITHYLKHSNSNSSINIRLQLIKHHTSEHMSINNKPLLKWFLLTKHVINTTITKLIE